MHNLMTREQLVNLVYSQHDDAPVSAVLLTVNSGQWVVGWHTPSGPYDIFVFEESFRGGNLQDWQERFLQNACWVVRSGNRNPNRFHCTYAVSYRDDNPFSPGVLCALKEAVRCPMNPLS